LRELELTRLTNVYVKNVSAIILGLAGSIGFTFSAVQ